MSEVVKDYIHIVKKVWGEEHWLVNTPLYCLKILIVDPGGCSSLHKHNVKDETFFVDEGSCFIEIDGETFRLSPGDSVRILPGQVHRFWVEKEIGIPCMIMEASTHHDDTDVVRHEESKRL